MAPCTIPGDTVEMRKFMVLSPSPRFVLLCPVLPRLCLCLPRMFHRLSDDEPIGPNGWRNEWMNLGGGTRPNIRSERQEYSSNGLEFQQSIRNSRKIGKRFSQSLSEYWIWSNCDRDESSVEEQFRHFDSEFPETYQAFLSDMITSSTCNSSHHWNLLTLSM